MHIQSFVRASIVGLVVLGGCDAAVESTDPVAFREEIGNGVNLNSAQINGTAFNGIALNGFHLNGWQLNGWQLNGWQLNSVSLVGTLFQGETQAGEAVAGLDFIGSEMTLTRDGQQYKLRMDDIYPDPAHPSGDVYFYAMSVLAPGASEWTSLCTDAAGDPIEAIPLRNAWDGATGDRVDDPALVTIACRAAVLAKCVEWGYRPWATATACDDQGAGCQQVSLRDHHQACTRMTRADYCGDGTPHTMNGTPIDVFDRLQQTIQARATAGNSHWDIEAEWGPDGAVCIGDALRRQMLADLGMQPAAAPCLDALDDLPACGTLPSARGGRVANAYCPEWIDDPTVCEGGDIEPDPTG